MKRLIALLFMLLAPAFLRASTAPVILGLQYQSSSPLLFIGSTMKAYMSAVIPTQTLTVSVTASTTGTITLGSTALAGIFPITNIYVTDGTRTWVAVAGGGSPTITFSDSQLLMQAPPFTLSDYNTLVNAPFRAYAGILVTEGAGASMNVDIGSFDNIALGDLAAGGDDFFGDGVWTGVYNVRDLGFVVTNGKLFGNVIANGQLASNGPYKSETSFELDGLRPKIDTQKITTGNPDYKGVLYLSKISQNTTTFQPTNDSARFDFTVNKRGVVLDIEIGTTPVKRLPPVVVPSNAVTLNAFKTWNGDSGNGTFVDDGIYPVTYYIRDLNNVTGLTVTSQIRVTSLRMQIKNVTMNPPTLTMNKDNPDWSDIVTLNYRLELFNEAGTAITSAMNALGFTGNTWGVADQITSTVIADGTQNFVAADGTPFTIERDGSTDQNSNYDSDSDFLVYFRADPRVLMGACFQNIAGVLGTTNVAGAVVQVGDGNKANDIDTLMPGFQPAVYGTPDPTLMTMYKGGSWRVKVDEPGSMRMRIIENLGGVDFYGIGDVASAPDIPNFCSSATLPYYRSRPVHFDTYMDRGYIQAKDQSVVFSITNLPPATLDTTPPLILSSNPQDETTFAPGSFGPGLPITIQIQDPESAIDPTDNTSIKITDPTGSFVGGFSATSGGGTNNTSTVTFTPFRSLTMGGKYTISLTACNISALCLSKELTFTIRDQTAPDVSAVELVSATQAGTIPLTLFQTSPDGDFDTITEVWATLSMPPSSSNTILWSQSTISLEQVSGTSRISIPMTRISPLGTSTPSDNRIKYRLTSAITSAGLFEVVVQTFSQDGSATQYTGPVNFVNPRFTTLINNNVLAIRYPNSTLALTGTQPIFVSFTASSFTPSNSNPAARLADFTVLPTNTGYFPLASAVSAGSLQFVVGGVPQTQPATWAYPAASPLRATLYYNDTDLPSGVLNSDLRVFGYSGSAWSSISSVSYIHTFTNVTANTFVVDLPNGSPAMAVYSIFYPSSANNNGGLGTPTAVPFKSTRSFNPTHASALYRKARFFYSDAPVKSVEARVFDTSGQLIRTLAVGNGISLGDTQTDALYSRTMYYFEWDGRNDGGTLARNGLYLVRWQVTKLDGGTETMTKPVAMIK